RPLYGLPYRPPRYRFALAVSGFHSCDPGSRRGHIQFLTAPQLLIVPLVSSWLSYRCFGHLKGRLPKLDLITPPDLRDPYHLFFIQKSSVARPLVRNEQVSLLKAKGRKAAKNKKHPGKWQSRCQTLCKPRNALSR